MIYYSEFRTVDGSRSSKTVVAPSAFNAEKLVYKDHRVKSVLFVVPKRFVTSVE